METNEQITEFISHDLSAMQATLRTFQSGLITPSEFFTTILDDAYEIVRQANKGKEQNA